MIGLETEFTASELFPRFNINIISTIFHCTGKYTVVVTQESDFNNICEN